MEANELRIGNLLKADIGFVKVESILGGTMRIYAHSLDEAYLADYPKDDLHPIPLSAELLEKCGGKEIMSDTYWAIGKEVLLNFDSCWWWTNEWEFDHNNEPYSHVGFKGIQYLHQLQNLYYCLCGKELDISLKKQT